MNYVLAVMSGVFIALKLAHVINWSWWIVFMPLYAAIAISLIIVTIGLICVYLKFKASQKEKSIYDLIREKGNDKI